MKLTHLRIRNFKGIRSLDIDFNGEDANLYGSNATGKTSVYDAFLWLLFDRDSANRKEFAIIPRDKKGGAVHHATTEVEGIVQHNGREIALRKTYMEKWTKKRGEAGRELAGHETGCFVEGLPCAKGEYAARIAGMMDEETFRLITHPGYFNTSLSWQERRKRLFELAGFYEEDERLAAFSTEFASLGGLLRGTCTEEALKSVRFSIKKLREELTVIPVRLDEICRSRPVQEEDWNTLEKERLQAGLALEEIEKSLSDAREMAQREAERISYLDGIRRKMEKRRETLESQSMRGPKEAAERLAQAEAEKARLYLLRERAEAERSNLAALAEKTRMQEQSLRARQREEAEKEFVAMGDLETCSFCGQVLPVQMAQNAIMSQRAAFMAQKDSRVGVLKEDAELSRHRAEILENQAAEAELRAAGCDREAEALGALCRELEGKAKRTGPAINLLEDVEYAQMSLWLQQEESAGKGAARIDTAHLLESKRVVADKLFEIQNKLAGRSQAQAVQKRIEELEMEKDRLVAKITGQEEIMAKMERFSAYKSALAEERINALFSTVKWKLFEKQLNGGIADCCECLVAGVPYLDANNAARINTGLEIIDVISRAAGISAPVFIDNRESINCLYPLRTQMIGLVVTEDKKLRVEIASGKTGEISA